LDKNYFGGSRALAYDINYMIEGTVTNNRIESMWGAIHLGTLVPGGGNCAAANIHGNWIEQVTHPFRFGSAGYWGVWNAIVTGNIVSNTQTSVVAARDVMFEIYDLESSIISENTLLPHPTEDVYRVHIQTALTHKRIENCVLDAELYEGASANSVIDLQSDNTNLEQQVGASNWFKWAPMSSQEYRVWESPVITCSVGFGGTSGSYEWIPADSLWLGGRIIEVQLIEASDPTNIDGELRIGDTNNVFRAVQQDLSLLTVDQYGYADIPITGSEYGLFGTEYGVVKNLLSVQPGVSSETFRIRILYRAS
jgi:hypothetical protein